MRIKRLYDKRLILKRLYTLIYVYIKNKKTENMINISFFVKKIIK